MSFCSPGIRTGHLHPAEPRSRLPSNTGGDHWRRCELSKSHSSRILEDSGRTRQLPTWVPWNIHAHINITSDESCLDELVIVFPLCLQRPGLQKRMRCSKAQLWRPTASFVWWMINCFPMMISGEKCLAVLCWALKRSDHMIFLNYRFSDSRFFCFWHQFVHNVFICHPFLYRLSCLTLVVKFTSGMVKRWRWHRGRWRFSWPNIFGTAASIILTVTSTRWTLEDTTLSYHGGSLESW